MNNKFVVQGLQPNKYNQKFKTADVDKIRFADGTEQTTATAGAGSGDMTKAVYDTNDDGVVNSAATLSGLSATVTELNYVSGVTSDLQTQLSNKQPLDTQLTDLSGLTYTGNANKVVSVKATEDGFELSASAGGGADTALSNLAAVAINTSLISDTDVTDDLGSALKKWNNLFIANIGATGTRATKVWATDIESTNMPTVSGTSLSATFEALANKATNFTTINDTLYPTVQAVQNAINTAVTGLLDYRGSYDASINSYPTTGGSGTAGAVLKGDFWICSVAGTLGGIAVTAGDLIIALIDTPAQTASNWDLISNELGYTPANNTLSNLGTVAINTSLISDTNNTDDIGSTAVRWKKGWFTDVEMTNLPTINGGTLANSLKAAGTDIDTGTDDTKFLTSKAVNDSHNIPDVAPGTSGNVLTSNGTDWTSSAPSGGGGAVWTAVPGTPTRTANTTFTVTGNYTALLTTGLVIKWTETSVVKVGMVLSSSYSSPNTTVTIIGDTMASIDASSCKYFSGEAIVKTFAVAGTLGTIATNIGNSWYADYAYRVIGAKPTVGTAGTTNNTTFDINKGGTTMFTTKPTIATTATTGTIFTADTGTSLAIGDKVTLDLDAVQTTAAIDGYVYLYLLPTRALSLN